jgi:hypothetical protein
MIRVVIVVPDAGLLISLAKAERLDLLTVLGLPVYIVDQVQWEATCNSDKPDAVAIAEFVEAKAELVHIAPTETGENALFAREAGRVGKRQASLGEAAISEFLTDFEARFEDASPLLDGFPSWPLPRCRRQVISSAMQRPWNVPRPGS